MKKVLFLFAFLLLGIGAMAQKVIYDETNQTGVRTVVCEGMNLGVSNNMDVYVALAGFQYKSTIRYSLAVTIGSGHEVEIPNDSKCVLTLDNGKALELPTVAGGASVLQHVDVEMSDVYQSFRRFAYYGDSFSALCDNNADSAGASSAVFHRRAPADTRYGFFHAGRRYGYDADR